MPDKELVMYSRSTPCPFVATAKQVLVKENLPFRELLIDEDDTARQRVRQWTGFDSVPTIIIAVEGQILPYEKQEPLEEGHSPRGIDRGSMITEPSAAQLQTWLQKHGLLEVDTQQNREDHFSW
ncbi:MAG TPA: glutaredoxin [Aggregatilineales bacterium]|nr:glutaredoxin [Aggregatilineales bacterium]